MSLSSEEREALFRIFGEAIREFCRDYRRVGLSLTYHRVKGKEYPALKVSCNGKFRKFHISRAKWQAFLEERERIKLEKVEKALKEFTNLKLIPENAPYILKVLTQLKELTENRKLWEFLFQNREYLPKETFPYYRFEDHTQSVEVWDIHPIKELRFVWAKRDAIRGEIKKREVLTYECKEENTYLLSVEPLNILKIEPVGMHLNNRWIVRKTDKGLFVNWF